LQTIIDGAVADTASGVNLSLSAEAVGGPLFAAHDEAVIRTDLQRTLLATSVACSLVLVAAFAGIGIPAAGLIALGTALVWLAAGLGLTRGSVSMVVVGFAAVLLGLGIDAAIHGGAALRRHTLAGLGRFEAALKTVQEVGPAVLTASITTAAAFGVLAFSALPPLRELGMVIAFGMAMVIIATATLGLALASLLGRFHGRAGVVWTLIGQLVDSVVSLAEAWPRAVVMLATLATAAAGTQITGIELRPDLSRLRPANHPVVEAGRRLASTFGIGGDTATLLITGDDLDQALAHSRSARAILGEKHPGITVLSPDQRLKGPKAISERLKTLRDLPFDEAATLLRAELLSAGLNPEAFSPGLSALEAFANGMDPGGERHTLVDQLQITEDGQTMAALALRLPEGLWPEGPPASVRAAVEKVAPGALFASMPWVGADLRRLASRDLRRLSGLSLGLILIVVGLSFKGRPAATLMALGPVAFGTIWAFGLWGAMGRHLDLFGLAVLPVMLGLGIDDGLYSVHGTGRDGASGIGRSVRNSGRAMVLTTLTTAIAFGSLGLSHLPALRAAALLVPLAVLSCLAATLVVLPAIAVLTRPLKNTRKRDPDESTD
ncbi:MAG: MMPL family transporter, partial [Acidobacteriota bacterium]